MSGEDEAFERALAALGRRERTRAELDGWLRERGFDGAQAAAAIERLIAAGALDDARFARLYAEDKRDLSGWGPERIRAALADRGVAAEHVDEALSGDDRERQLERARGLLAGRGERLDDDRARARALAFLTRRGYEYELAHAAVRRFSAAG